MLLQQPCCVKSQSTPELKQWLPLPCTPAFDVLLTPCVNVMMHAVSSTLAARNLMLNDDTCSADARSADACSADACSADACSADACSADACSVTFFAARSLLLRNDGEDECMQCDDDR